VALAAQSGEALSVSLRVDEAAGSVAVQCITQR
jgi:hypothetical protein